MKPKLERIRELADEVLDVRKGDIGTHYEGCWKNHVGCLAFYIKTVATREENE